MQKGMKKSNSINFEENQESHFFNECRPEYHKILKNDKSESNNNELLFTDEEIKEGLRELHEGVAQARRTRQIQYETLIDDDVRNRLYR
jgi:hypothetical protein